MVIATDPKKRRREKHGNFILFKKKKTYRKKEKNKNQKMWKHLTRHFSSLGFHLLISFVPSTALYLGCWCCCSRWHASTHVKSPNSHVAPPSWGHLLLGFFFFFFFFSFVFLLLTCFNFSLLQSPACKCCSWDLWSTIIVVWHHGHN